MVAIHPSSNETFYLRMLLKHVAGPTSYEDLRTTPDGICHPTFRDACIALGLCEDDSQWIACMEEAVAITHPGGLRALFCNILVNCKPAKPRDMFDQFSNQMSANFLYQRKKDEIISAKDLQKMVENK